MPGRGQYWKEGGLNDGVVKVEDLEQTVQDSVSKSFLSGQVTSQNTDKGVNDHIKFDTIIESNGTKITLDTMTAYTNTLNVASVGRITLQAGSTYKLTGGVRVVYSGGGTSDIQFRNADSGAVFGPILTPAGPSNSANITTGNIIITVFKPSVDTRIEIVILSATSINQFDGTNTYILVEEL